MNTLRHVLDELWSLFVDDGNLALLSLALVATITVLVEFIGLPPLFGACVVLVGCIAILVESVSRAARQRTGRIVPERLPDDPV